MNKLYFIGKLLILIVPPIALTTLLHYGFSFGISLGIISLIITIAPGFDFIKKNLQYIKFSRFQKPADVWLSAGVSFSVMAIMYDFVNDKLSLLESLVATSVLSIAIALMLASVAFGIDKK
ncbi:MULTISPECIES: hypothetical protein [unclassified Cedecea]|uniref:hypothetical protein n=1 Tax=unclassified Cedecea TaxID=2649846 RepID=UPI003018AC94